MNRRNYLLTVTGAGATLALAGCTGADPADEPDDAPDESEQGGDESDDEPNEPEEPEEPGEPDRAGTFDDFEDLEPWEAAMGSLTADGERSYEGSQSALLEASESEERVWIVRELSDPEDFSGLAPGLAVTAPNEVDVTIRLLDGGDYVEYRQYFAGGVSFLRRNFGISNVEGDPDLGEVTEIHVGRWVGDESTTEFRIDDLHFTPAPTPGRVMLHFDGGFETAHSTALPILEERDLTAATFVPPSRLGEASSEEEEGSEGSDRLTEEQIAELADAGWTVGSHGARGVTLAPMDDEEKESAVVEAAEWLADAGYDAEFFSYPASQYDETAYELIREHHELGFAGRYAAHGDVSNPHLVSRATDPDAEEARRLLDWTAAFGGITSLVFYDLDDESAGTLESTADHLAELAANGDLEVVSPADLAADHVH